MIVHHNPRTKAVSNIAFRNNRPQNTRMGLDNVADTFWARLRQTVQTFSTPHKCSSTNLKKRPQSAVLLYSENISFCDAVVLWRNILARGTPFRARSGSSACSLVFAFDRRLHCQFSSQRDTSRLRVRGTRVPGYLQWYRWRIHAAPCTAALGQYSSIRIPQTSLKAPAKIPRDSASISSYRYLRCTGFRFLRSNISNNKSVQ